MRGRSPRLTWRALAARAPRPSCGCVASTRARNACICAAAATLRANCLPARRMQPAANAEAPAARYAARLKRPDGGDGTVWLLPVHGDVTRSAKEMAELVTAVKPAKVVLQLDVKTFEFLQNSYRRRLHRLPPLLFPADVAERGVRALVDAAAEGKLLSLATDYKNAFLIAVDGGSRQSHFYGPVLDAALAVGAEIVLADRDPLITASRVAARQAADDRESDISRPAALLKMGSDACAAAEAALQRARVQHGCLNPKQEGTEAAYALIAEAALFGRVRHVNLAALRACQTASRDVIRDWELILAAPALRAAGGVAPPVTATVTASRDPGAQHNSAVARTVYAERELLFARALQPPSAPERDVVGIFDADHVAGIARAWAGARSPEADALAAEYMRPIPSDASAPASHKSYGFGLPPAVEAVATLAATAHVVLKSAKPLRNAVLLGAAGVAAPVAAFSVAQRALSAVVEADSRLRTMDQLALQEKRRQLWLDNTRSRIKLHDGPRQ